MTTYYVGALVRVSVVFKDNATPPVAADPSTVVFKYQNPAGEVTTLTYPDAAVVKDSTGNYHVDVNLNAEGNWSFRWVGTGAVQAAVESALNVAHSVFV